MKQGETQPGKSGQAQGGRKVKGTLHWVSAAHAVRAEVRLYEHLFTVENPGDEKAHPDFTACLNPRSLEVLTDCRVEPGLARANPGDRFQFLRMGYFAADRDSTEKAPVFNRTVTLRDTWAKIARKG